MKPELLIGLFALCATLYVALTLWLRRHQRMLGIGHGRLLAADDSRSARPSFAPGASAWSGDLTT
ncbi:MAG: hypothetical protein M3P51_07135 [Chloroflexota bacterium]|nr:hypothetical protein [Chloroflexota bacterium]